VQELLFFGDKVIAFSGDLSISEDKVWRYCGITRSAIALAKSLAFSHLTVGM
jgi:hypothetical protein